ncbi:unnamed protein product [Dibothriocephalus latus]|uniref:SP-RING-type domain-containing protein n=1 Tax=Dibothriocephalus latus TaxID=60516 RepID=A0A3P6Q543_DIBLA|nr:unnamed protein product [Dibothriocephalus latus]
MQIPVRSVNCDHLQCFDLSSYLAINKKRPRWSCPVCSLPAPFRDLRRDDFFVQMVADQSLKDAEMVHVDVSGQWQEVSKPPDSASSAVISIKDPIFVIPSDNPTIAAVPSLLHDTSMIRPYILDSNLPPRPVTPIGPDCTQFNGCILRSGDSDENVRECSATQPQQSTVAHPTSSSGCRGQCLPPAVTDEQSGKHGFAMLDSAPRM